MHEKDLKKDMTIYEFAVFMMKYFDRSQNALTLEMRTGFAEVHHKLSEIDLRLYKAEKERKDLKDGLDRIERQHNVRLEIVEDRTVVLKKTIEKELGTKVAW